MMSCRSSIINSILEIVRGGFPGLGRCCAKPFPRVRPSQGDAADGPAGALSEAAQQGSESMSWALQGLNGAVTLGLRICNQHLLWAQGI